jgi:hypothetical protein
MVGDCVVFIKKLISGDFSLFLSFGGCKRKKKTLISNIFFANTWSSFHVKRRTRFQTLKRVRPLAESKQKHVLNEEKECFSSIVILIEISF